ncbi:NAD(P)/FAD-dependent oxidoreductase [Thalassobacillus hwangdonensis]|uniref:NAD(P)/FAD-dependent oxidoreductase n=1 Tax=Thalassobacillus hwangdonensis TaxID=546108 RepID=A0ABW3KZZ3_9BACI
MSHKADIIIVGGGVMGSSVAYHLLKEGYDGDVFVFEKDKMYEFASTPRSAGGIRQLFTTDVNIQISRYSLKKYESFPEDMAIDGEPAMIDFKQRGYLFLSDSPSSTSLEEQQARQQKYGVPSQLLEEKDLLDIIPELNTEDLTYGLYCHEDGYLDPYSVMQGYIKKAKQLGATYIYDGVAEITKDKSRVTGVRTTSGDVYQSPIVVNCAGPWAAQLSSQLGVQVPVIPLKRQVIKFDIAEPLSKPLPLTIDPTGVYFRHEGDELIAGYSEPVTPSFNFDWKRSFFLETLWPILAHRVKNFERAKVTSGWAGLYSHNTEDQNAIIGGHPEVAGYYMACGFSGHGMQQAPAVGKGLAELILHQRYHTLDLSPLRIERFAEKNLVVEGAIV